MNKNDIIAVGLSGGVDSSVALYLIQQEWTQVVGASHDICTQSKTCNNETLGRARALCDQSKIPYYVLNLIDEFSAHVIDDFTNAYCHGFTPNPCVRCNERIRFSLFYQLLKEVLIKDGRLNNSSNLYIATGHYARRGTLAGFPVIYKGADTTKDQSYMLYRIPVDILPFVIFPLGNKTKQEIVALAVEKGFPSSSVKESQDICFVPGKYTDILEDRLGRDRVLKEGYMYDTQNNLLGKHKGYMHYTIGQRQGLGLGNGPWYVRTIDAENNIVIVGRKEELLDKGCIISETNWFVPQEQISTIQQKENLELQVKIRYNSREIPCLIQPVTLRTDQNSMQNGLVGEYQVLFLNNQVEAVTPGQSAVFYLGDAVVGGGIIISELKTFSDI